MLKNKKILYGIIGICLIFIIGIVIIFSRNKVIICAKESNQEKSNFIYKTKYVIKARNSNVKSVSITEFIESSDKKVLEKYGNQLKKEYSYNKKAYGGYTYKVEIKNNQVIGKTTIDYKEFDLEYFIENNEAMKEYTENNKLTLDGAKKMYEATGAVCK